MLNLSVSSQRCIPGQDVFGNEPRPDRCGTCGAPGGAKGELLEKHVAGKSKSHYLCPLCHACLHLDVAGRLNAGRIIWLPELSQEQLNLLCLASFVAVSRAGVYRDDRETTAMVEHARRLYRTFEKRSEAVEAFLCGNVSQALLPRHTLSTPTHVASLIVSAQRETGLDARTIAKRLEGLRLLPNPKAFEGYVTKVSRLTGKEFAVDTWMPVVQRELDAIQAAAETEQAQEDETSEHFDAGENIDATPHDAVTDAAQ
jgi:hypothetical protein